MTENYVLNDGHIHEAIDRIHVAISYLQSTLAGHSLIGSVSEYEAQVQSAIKILSDLYQKSGSMSTFQKLQRYTLLKRASLQPIPSNTLKSFASPTGTVVKQGSPHNTKEPERT